ncbi:hypothetical protein [Saccharothrix sp. HUAS TT1]|uniref:hypothetical protein n=1 Tax=unclassified Saccharothrix TaxID=2593673 RepID=UPI00345BBFC8
MPVDQLLTAGVRVVVTEGGAHPSVLRRNIPNLTFGGAQALLARLRGIRVLGPADVVLYTPDRLDDVLAALLRHSTLPEDPTALPTARERAEQARREREAAANTRPRSPR